MRLSSEAIQALAAHETLQDKAATI
jgi:hypothetical protein